jgi:hypothetical protein
MRFFQHGGSLSLLVPSAARLNQIYGSNKSGFFFSLLVLSAM